MKTRNLLLLGLAFAGLVALLAPTAGLADPRCLPTQKLDSATRASVWMNAVDEFMAAHPDLDRQQLALLERAPSVGFALRGSLRSADRTPNASLLSIRAFVAEAERVFSPIELAQLFSRMGTLQSWLIQNHAFGATAIPYCNCEGSGSCTFGGGPTGSCEAGCVSWEEQAQAQLQAVRYDGLCSAN